MGMFSSNPPQTSIPQEEKEFYIVFTYAKYVNMVFDTLDQAQTEAEIQAKRYPGENIKIWGFNHIKTVHVPTGEPLSWSAGSNVDEAIKAAKEAGKKVLNSPFDLVEDKHG